MVKKAKKRRNHFVKKIIYIDNIIMTNFISSVMNFKHKIIYFK